MSAPIGHPSAEALGEGDGVGHDPGLLEREPGAGAADAGLDLVEDEQGAVLPGQLPGELQVCRAGAQHPCLTLDGFEDDGGRVGRHRGSQGVLVAVGDVADAGDERLERLAVGELVGQREGTGRAAVEGTLGGDDAGRGRCGGSA